ncbi:MAG TPA: transposase, partial [Aestuariivirga sp.]|nr:transposase [Aestuariivirga sp.]
MGLPVAVTLSGGEASDFTGFTPVLDEPGPEPKILIADKGYDSDTVREDLVRRGAEPVILHRIRKTLGQTFCQHGLNLECTSFTATCVSLLHTLRTRLHPT